MGSVVKEEIGKRCLVDVCCTMNTLGAIVRSGMLKCCICADTSSCNPNQLEAHIAAVHFDCTPYECDHCKYSKFPNEYAVRRHLEEDHGLSQYYVKFQVTQALEEKKGKVQECLQLCLQQPDTHTSRLFPTACISKMLNPVFKSKKEMEEEGTGSDVPSGATPHERSTPDPIDLKPVIELSDTDDNQDEAHGSEQANHTATVVATMRNSCSSNSSCVAPEDTFGVPWDNTGASNLTPPSSRNLHRSTGSNQHCNKNPGKLIKIAMEQDIADAEQISAKNTRQGEEQNGTNQTVEHENIQDNDQTSDDMHASTPEIVTESLASPPLAVDKQSTSASTPSHRQLTVKFRRNSLHGITSCEVQDEPLEFTFDKESHLEEMHSPEIPLPNTSLASLAALDPNLCLLNQPNTAVECIMCKELVPNKLADLNRHVNTKHTKFPFYKCKECAHDFYWSKQEVVSHIQQMHPGTQDCIIDNCDLYYSRLNLRQPRFFNLREEKGNTGVATANVYEQQAPSRSPTHTYDQPDAMEIIDNSQLIISDFNQLLKGASLQLSTPDLKESVHSKNASDSALIAGTSSRPGLLSARRTACTTAKNRKYACTRCLEPITALDWTLLNHVNSHLHMPLFECLGCGKKFEKYLRSYMVRHVKHHHNSDHTLIVDHRHKYKQELAEGCLRFFPRDSSSISLDSYI